MTIEKCEICGKPFEKKRYNQKYCSRICQLEANRTFARERQRRMSTFGTIYKKICPFCGKLFTTTDKRKIYCSSDCQMKINIQRKKEQRQQWLKDNEENPEKTITENTVWLIKDLYKEGFTKERIAKMTKKPLEIVCKILETENKKQTS